MSVMMQQLNFYLSFAFVRYAILVGVLVALCSSLLGVTLVLKRFSFIGDGLSHVAFGATAIATVLSLKQDMLFVLPVTIAAAVLLLHSGRRARVHGDAMVAMTSVGALALGYLAMNLFPNFSKTGNLSADVCTTLFGSTSILTLRIEEVWLSAALALLVLIVFVLFYHKIFAVTFDESFAAATGTPTGLYNLLVAVVIAVMIVLAMKMVGSLLISALVVFPPLCAMRFCKSFLGVTVASAVIAVVSAMAGLLIAVMGGTPVGSTIVAANIAAFALSSAVGWAIRRRKA